MVCIHSEQTWPRPQILTLIHHVWAREAIETSVILKDIDISLILSIVQFFLLIIFVFFCSKLL